MAQADFGGPNYQRVPKLAPKWPLLLKKDLTTAIVKHLVVRNNTNLLADILDIWANGQWMPYADSRVTDNLFGLKPGSLWPLKWLAIVYTT